MAYYVLPNRFPSQGTPGNLSGLAEFFKNAEKDKRNEAIRKAIEDDGGYDATYRQDAEGDYSAVYTKPQHKPMEKSDFRDAIAGLKPMKDVFSPGEVDQAIGRAVGEAAAGEGKTGQVMAPPGATFKDGSILDASGRQIGEYPEGQAPQVNFEGLRQALRSEIEADPYKQAALNLKTAVPKQKKMSFNDHLKEAISGQRSWEDLEMLYPTTSKIKEIRAAKARNTPVSMSKDFTPGTGTPVSKVKSFFNDNQAELSQETYKVIDNIKNQADLDELVKNAEDYEAAGVDVKAIMEYFGVK